MKPLILLTLLLPTLLFSQKTDFTKRGYLFAHMTKEDYGRLYYSVSLDGRHWLLLNQGKRVMEDYRGHPDVIPGHDGRYYLLGNPEPDQSPKIYVYVSDDLISWERHAEIKADMSSLPEFNPITSWHGAAKLFYDAPNQEYIITWHSATESREVTHPWYYWNSMRTLYMKTKDWRTMTKPKRLLPYDQASIDTILRRVGDTYYAIIKDEQYPDATYPHGKTIRICTAPSIEGPWSEPGEPISPNFSEAPNAIPRPDGLGWYIYSERYPGKHYMCATAPSLKGPFFDIEAYRFEIPEGARHGSMVPIPRKLYDGLLDAFPPSEEALAHYKENTLGE